MQNPCLVSTLSRYSSKEFLCETRVSSMSLARSDVERTLRKFQIEKRGATSPPDETEVRLENRFPSCGWEFYSKNVSGFPPFDEVDPIEEDFFSSRLRTLSSSASHTNEVKGS